MTVSQKFDQDKGFSLINYETITMTKQILQFLIILHENIGLNDVTKIFLCNAENRFFEN